MEFNYKELGNALAFNRISKGLRQTDLEELSSFQLKQPAISAAEHGETRLAVDTLILYCNLLGIRPDMVLEPFLTTEPENDASGAIVDPYVIRLAGLMKNCSPSEKTAILRIAEIIIMLNDKGGNEST